MLQLEELKFPQDIFEQEAFKLQQRRSRKKVVDL